MKELVMRELGIESAGRFSNGVMMMVLRVGEDCSHVLGPRCSAPLLVIDLLLISSSGGWCGGVGRALVAVVCPP